MDREKLRSFNVFRTRATLTVQQPIGYVISITKEQQNAAMVLQEFETQPSPAQRVRSFALNIVIVFLVA